MYQDYMGYLHNVIEENFLVQTIGRSTRNLKSFIFSIICQNTAFKFDPNVHTILLSKWNNLSILTKGVNNNLTLGVNHTACDPCECSGGYCVAVTHHKKELVKVAETHFFR